MTPKDTTPATSDRARLLGRRRRAKRALVSSYLRELSARRDGPAPTRRLATDTPGDQGQG